MNIQSHNFYFNLQSFSSSISSIIDKHFNLLQSSNRCKNTFKESLVAYWRSPNLRDFLIKAQLPPNRNNAHNSTPSSFQCGRPQCLTCPYILRGLNILSLLLVEHVQ